MRVLITGSQGVLGTALKRELGHRYHQVFGCDLMHSCDNKEIRADVANYRELYAAFKLAKPELVVHLAGEFGRKNGQDFYERLWSTNCIGTHNVAELCQRFGSRLIFASSSEAYGNLADYHDLDESLLANSVPRFHNEYSLTKWAGEKQIEIARDHGNLRALSLRFFNVYGEEPFSEYRSVVCKFIYRLLQRIPITVYKGSRDFLYITDWSRTVANAVERFDSLPEHAYNIGGVVSTSIYDLAFMIGRICGIEPSSSLIEFHGYEQGNVNDKMPEIELARRDLDHRPEMDLAHGLELTVAWMRQRYDIPKINK